VCLRRLGAAAARIRETTYFYTRRAERKSCVARSFGSGTKYVAELSDDIDLLIACSIHVQSIAKFPSRLKDSHRQFLSMRAT